MSVSYYAYLVYGVVVNKDDLHEEISERGCDHTEIPTAKFCPDCGEPMYTFERENQLDDFSSGYDDILSYYAHTYEDEEVVLGFALGRVGGYSDSHVLSDLSEPTEQQKQEIIDFCNQVGIDVCEEHLKKHLVLYVSY